MWRPLTALFFAILFVRAGQAAPQEIVVCTYNVENYTHAQPAGGSSPYGTRAKSEKSIAALIAIIKEVNPDVLGVCEMGSPERFEHFKKRLNEAGLGYTDSEYLQAVDPDRHLALVSRFPIVARNSAADVPYELNGQPEKMRRGILDVTIQVNASYQLRMVGVHLKSKLPVPQGEALIRRHEAQELRKHLTKILTAEPRTNLVCYGDFNDTKNEPMFAEISGAKKSPTYMADLWARDSVGDRWTYFWRPADQYSRIDYLFVSSALFPEVVKTKSSIYRSDDWQTASDHRPVSAAIIPLDQK